MSCDRCSRRTTRNHLCRNCANDERHGQSLDSSTVETESKKILTIECCGDSCETVREVAASARKECPDCGYDGYRVLEVRSATEVVA